MAEKSKKPTPNKPKFSAWWIYTAIILVFLALNFFSSGSDFGQLSSLTNASILFYYWYCIVVFFISVQMQCKKVLQTLQLCLQMRWPRSLRPLLQWMQPALDHCDHEDCNDM